MVLSLDDYLFHQGTGKYIKFRGELTHFTLLIWWNKNIYSKSQPPEIKVATVDEISATAKRWPMDTQAPYGSRRHTYILVFYHFFRSMKLTAGPAGWQRTYALAWRWWWWWWWWPPFNWVTRPAGRGVSIAGTHRHFRCLFLRLFLFQSLLWWFVSTENKTFARTNWMVV